MIKAKAYGLLPKRMKKTLGHKHGLCYVSISILNLTNSTQVLDEGTVQKKLVLHYHILTR